MIKRTFEITARIEQGRLPLCFQVVQNDKDVYVLHIRITEGDKEIDYTQVSSATITFALANGAVVQSDPERLAISSGGITYEMGTSEISCPGKVLASIQLLGEDGERLTTARFQFEVVADLITPGAVQSESRFPILQQLVADVEQLKQDIVDLQIPDNSIMDEKLSNAAGQIKQRFASHMADIVTDADGAHGLKVESGTFTPVLKFGGNNVGMTLDRQFGQYYKIGKIVHIEVELRLTAKGTSEGAATIEGLPFVKATGPVWNSSYALGSYAYLVCPTNVTGFCLRISSSTSNILLYGLRSNDNLAGISHSQFNNNTHIYFGLTYLTN